MRKNQQHDFADIDVVGLVVVILILGALYYFFMFPPLRGPAADMEVSTAIEPNGDISQYKVTMQFVDDLSYTQFLSFLNTQKIPSINDYEFRTFSSSQPFLVTNNSNDKSVTIEAKTPFDPNNMTMNIRIKKYSEFWEFEDKSIINSSHLPEQYINKLTYTLTIPSKLIYANTLDNSSIPLSEGKKLTWHIDRNKNPLNPKGDSIASPTIYAKFKPPEQNPVPVVPILIGIGVLGVVAFILIIRR